MSLALRTAGVCYGVGFAASLTSYMHDLGKAGIAFHHDIAYIKDNRPRDFRSVARDVACYAFFSVVLGIPFGVIPSILWPAVSVIYIKNNLVNKKV